MRRPLWFLVRGYVRWRLRRALDHLALGGAAGVPPGPVVFAATHGSWWDGLLALWVAGELGRTVRIVVDAPTVARLPWLRHVGVIALDRSSPFHMLAGMRRLREALAAGESVWIFPEGEMGAWWRRPLRVSPGAARLAGQAGVPLLPVSTAWRMPASPGLSAAVWLGRPCTADQLAPRLEEGIDRGLAWLERREGPFSARWDLARTPDTGAGARLLTRLAG